MAEEQPRNRGQGLLQTQGSAPQGSALPSTEGPWCCSVVHSNHRSYLFPHQQEAEQEQLWEDSGRTFSGEPCSTKGLSSAQ